MNEHHHLNFDGVRHVLPIRHSVRITGLIVEHNHGETRMIDCEWFPYPVGPQHCNPNGDNGYVVGFLVSDRVTNRLFGATSTKVTTNVADYRYDYIPLSRLRPEHEAGGYRIDCRNCG